MIEGISEELQAYLEEVALELRGGGPPPQHIPIPERWDTLLDQVDVAASLHAHDPDTYELHRIGRFDVLRLHGQGAYGLVFEAIDPLLRRRVALKLCEFGNGETVDDDLAEARLLAAVSHPNVITVYDIGLYGQDLFIVMEFATGRSAHHFAGSGPPWQEIVDVYLGAAAGLAAAHAEQIVHGDFKPDNILVDADGSRPRVADFGLARIRLEHAPEHEREQVRARGVRGYTAPEVLRGRAADALSDQWAFCASLWRSLEGAVPFEAESTDRLLAAIEQMNPQRVNATVPEALRAVLERGLSLDPADRFPSMQALRQALELVRNTAASPPHVSPERRRHRTQPGWGSFAIMALITVASLVTAVSQRHAAGVVRPGVGVALVVPGPQPRPTGCALTRAEADHEVAEEVRDVCEKIRNGNVRRAGALWLRERDDRTNNRKNLDSLPTDTLIVARTFVGQAETFLFDGRHEDATDAQQRALMWATEAASKLGHEHAGVQFVLFRQELVKDLIHSQHSTTPLPSMLP